MEFRKITSIEIAKRIGRTPLAVRESLETYMERDGLNPLGYVRVERLPSGRTGQYLELPIDLVVKYLPKGKWHGVDALFIEALRKEVDSVRNFGALKKVVGFTEPSEPVPVIEPWVSANAVLMDRIRVVEEKLAAARAEIDKTKFAAEMRLTESMTVFEFAKKNWSGEMPDDLFDAFVKFLKRSIPGCTKVEILGIKINDWCLQNCFAEARKATGR